MILLSYLLACAPDKADPPAERPDLSEDSPPADTGEGRDSEPPVDTDPPEVPDTESAPPDTEVPDTEGEVPPEELPEVENVDGDLSESFFSLDRVHSIELTLSEGAINALGADPYTEVVGEVLLDGVSFEDVAIRLKGRLGSYRSLSGKSGFKLDFNDLVPGRTVMDLEKLNLNNMVQDCSMVHDRTAYLLYNAVGINTPRIGYIWVSVNGSAYGLYAAGEPYDDVFLEYRYEEPNGNLYDGDYVMFANGSYSLLDFEWSVHDLFQLDEGTDVGYADIHAVTQALDDAAAYGDFMKRLGAVVDMDQFLRYWAVEAWVGQYDGYVYNRNNYRVYFNPETGLAEFFPWDHDWAFYDYVPLTSPYGRLASSCKADSECHRLFLQAVAEVSAVADTMGLDAEVDATTALINSYAQLDPRKEYSMSSVMSCQSHLLNWISTRSATLQATVGL